MRPNTKFLYHIIRIYLTIMTEPHWIDVHFGANLRHLDRYSPGRASSRYSERDYITEDKAQTIVYLEIAVLGTDTDI